MNVCVLFIMSLNTSDNFIHDSHDVAYALIDSAKTETKTKTKLKQKNKTAITTTIRVSNLSLNLQLTDYMTMLLRYK